MLEKLISSKTRLSILSLFFANKDKDYYLQEIVNKTNLDAANVKKELENLISGGFVVVKTQGSKKLFEIDKHSPSFGALSDLFKIHSEALRNSGDYWVLLEEMPDYYPMFVASGWDAEKANGLFARLGLKNKFSELVAKYENNMGALLVKKNEFYDLSNEIINRFATDETWGKKYINGLEEKQKILINLNEKLRDTNLVRLSDKELLGLFKVHYNAYRELHVNHWIQTAADFGENVFSKLLMGYLKDKANGHKFSIGEVFSILTTPTEEGTATKEYKDLLIILNDILRNKKIKEYFLNTETRIITRELEDRSFEINNKIEDHVRGYGWLGYGSIGPGWNKEYFIDILSSLIRQGLDPVRLIKEMDSNLKNTKEKQVDLIKRLGIDDKYQRLFEIARGLVFTKGTRKDSMFFFLSVIENVYREISRRRYLSLRQIRYMYPWEFDDLLLKENFSTEVLNNRIKFNVHYSTLGSKGNQVLDGAKAKQLWDSLVIEKEDIKDVKNLVGDCASPGKARGKAKIINQAKDMDNFKEGDILVSIATTPDLVPAMKRAGAIITDQGGITCHAAIVSRELGIPCIIGTKFATKLLKDGTIVDVDATHGKVTIIEQN